MEKVIEYFESQEDALEFAKCLDCAKYLAEQDIVNIEEIKWQLYDKFTEYTKPAIRDSLMRKELFLSVFYQKNNSKMEVNDEIY